MKHGLVVQELPLLRLICYHNENGFNDVEVKTLGGTLTVEFDRIDDSHYSNIWLSGPAEKVFEGTIEL